MTASEKPVGHRSSARNRLGVAALVLGLVSVALPSIAIGALIAIEEPSVAGVEDSGRTVDQRLLVPALMLGAISGPAAVYLGRRIPKYPGPGIDKRWNTMQRRSSVGTGILGTIVNWCFLLLQLALANP